MKKALRVTTTGEEEEIDIAEDGLRKLQTAVGGWVQAIDLTPTLTLWCNEEGKLVDLPHNPYGQFLWNSTFGAHTDYIVGDIVVTGGTDDMGDTMGLGESDEAALRKALAKLANLVG